MTRAVPAHVQRAELAMTLVTGTGGVRRLTLRSATRPSRPYREERTFADKNFIYTRATERNKFEHEFCNLPAY